MARPATSPAVRIKALEAAKQRAKTLKRGEHLSAMPMAQLIGVSWPTLRDWCRDIPALVEKGAFEGGGNGIEYSFNPRKTIDVLIAHFTAERDARRKRASRIRKIVTGSDAPETVEDFDLDEMRKMLGLSNSLQDAKVKSNELVRRDVVSDLLRQVFTSMQQAGVKVIQQADPTGQMLPETRSIVEDVVRSLLLAQERAAQECLRGLNGGAA